MEFWAKGNLRCRGHFSNGFDLWHILSKQSRETFRHILVRTSRRWLNMPIGAETEELIGRKLTSPPILVRAFLIHREQISAME
jgi:hypothetical protein